MSWQEDAFTTSLRSDLTIPRDGLWTVASCRYATRRIPRRRHRPLIYRPPKKSGAGTSASATNLGGGGGSEEVEGCALCAWTTSQQQQQSGISSHTTTVCTSSSHHQRIFSTSSADVNGGGNVEGGKHDAQIPVSKHEERPDTKNNNNSKCEGVGYNNNNTTTTPLLYRKNLQAPLLHVHFDNNNNDILSSSYFNLSTTTAVVGSTSESVSNDATAPSNVAKKNATSSSAGPSSSNNNNNDRKMKKGIGLPTPNGILCNTLEGYCAVFDRVLVCSSTTPADLECTSELGQLPSFSYTNIMPTSSSADRGALPSTTATTHTRGTASSSVILTEPEALSSSRKGGFFHNNNNNKSFWSRGAGGHIMMEGSSSGYECGPDGATLRIPLGDVESITLEPIHFSNEKDKNEEKDNDYCDDDQDEWKEESNNVVGSQEHEVSRATEKNVNGRRHGGDTSSSSSSSSDGEDLYIGATNELKGYSATEVPMWLQKGLAVTDASLSPRHSRPRGYSGKNETNTGNRTNGNLTMDTLTTRRKANNPKDKNKKETKNVKKDTPIVGYRLILCCHVEDDDNEGGGRDYRRENLDYSHYSYPIRDTHVVIDVPASRFCQLHSLTKALLYLVPFQRIGALDPFDHGDALYVCQCARRYNLREVDLRAFEFVDQWYRRSREGAEEDSDEGEVVVVHNSSDLNFSTIPSDNNNNKNTSWNKGKRRQGNASGETMSQQLMRSRVMFAPTVAPNCLSCSNLQSTGQTVSFLANPQIFNFVLMCVEFYIRAVPPIDRVEKGAFTYPTATTAMPSSLLDKIDTATAPRKRTTTGSQQRFTKEELDAVQTAPEGIVEYIVDYNVRAGVCLTNHRIILFSQREIVEKLNQFDLLVEQSSGYSAETAVGTKTRMIHGQQQQNDDPSSPSLANGNTNPSPAVREAVPAGRHRSSSSRSRRSYYAATLMLETCKFMESVPWHCAAMVALGPIVDTIPSAASFCSPSSTTEQGKKTAASPQKESKFLKLKRNFDGSCINFEMRIVFDTTMEGNDTATTAEEEKNSAETDDTKNVRMLYCPSFRLSQMLLRLWLNTIAKTTRVDTVLDADSLLPSQRAGGSQKPAEEVTPVDVNLGSFVSNYNNNNNDGRNFNVNSSSLHGSSPFANNTSSFNSEPVATTTTTCSEYIPLLSHRDVTSRTLQILERLHRQFSAIDTSGDGNIDEGELDDAIGSLFTSQNFVTSFFRAFDLNGDGNISFTEFTVGLVDLLCGSFEGRVRFSFRMFDRDYDGKVTRDEFANVLETLVTTGDINVSTDYVRAVADKVFDRIDTDHNDELSFTEYMTASLNDAEVCASLKKLGLVMHDQAAKRVSMNLDTKSTIFGGDADWTLATSVMQALLVSTNYVERAHHKALDAPSTMPEDNSKEIQHPDIVVVGTAARVSGEVHAQSQEVLQSHSERGPNTTTTTTTTTVPSLERKNSLKDLKYEKAIILPLNAPVPLVRQFGTLCHHCSEGGHRKECPLCQTQIENSETSEESKDAQVLLTCFYPYLFRYLRESVFGLGVEQFKSYLGVDNMAANMLLGSNKALLRMHERKERPPSSSSSTGGNSNTGNAAASSTDTKFSTDMSNFCYISHDHNLVIKSVSSIEAQNIVTSLPQYAEYMTRNHHSLLHRYFGLYRISTQQVSHLSGGGGGHSSAVEPQIFFVVVANFLHSEKPIRSLLLLQGRKRKSLLASATGPSIRASAAAAAGGGGGGGSRNEGSGGALVGRSSNSSGMLQEGERGGSRGIVGSGGYGSTTGGTTFQSSHGVGVTSYEGGGGRGGGMGSGLSGRDPGSMMNAGGMGNSMLLTARGAGVSCWDEASIDFPVQIAEDWSIALHRQLSRDASFLAGLGFIRYTFAVGMELNYRGAAAMNAIASSTSSMKGGMTADKKSRGAGAGGLIIDQLAHPASRGGGGGSAHANFSVGSKSGSSSGGGGWNCCRSAAVKESPIHQHPPLELYKSLPKGLLLDEHVIHTLASLTISKNAAIMQTTGSSTMSGVTQNSSGGQKGRNNSKGSLISPRNSFVAGKKRSFVSSSAPGNTNNTNSNNPVTVTDVDLLEFASRGMSTSFGRSKWWEDNIQLGKFRAHGGGMLSDINETLLCTALIGAFAYPPVKDKDASTAYRQRFLDYLRLVILSAELEETDEYHSTTAASHHKIATQLGLHQVAFEAYRESGESCIAVVDKFNARISIHRHLSDKPVVLFDAGPSSGLSMCRMSNILAPRTIVMLRDLLRFDRFPPDFNKLRLLRFPTPRAADLFVSLVSLVRRLGSAATERQSERPIAYAMVVSRNTSTSNNSYNNMRTTTATGGGSKEHSPRSLTSGSRGGAAVSMPFSRATLTSPTAATNPSQAAAAVEGSSTNSSVNGGTSVTSTVGQIAQFSPRSLTSIKAAASRARGARSGGAEEPEIFVGLSTKLTSLVVVTMNIGDIAPTNLWTCLRCAWEPHQADIVVVHVQNCIYNPPHHTESIDQHLFQLIDSALPGFSCLRRVKAKGTYIFLFTTPSAANAISNMETATTSDEEYTTSTQLDGAALAFTYFDSSLCFLTADMMGPTGHEGSTLTSAEDCAVPTRRSCTRAEISRLFSNLLQTVNTHMGTYGLDVCNEFHHVFWCGSVPPVQIAEATAPRSTPRPQPQPPSQQQQSTRTTTQGEGNTNVSSAMMVAPYADNEASAVERDSWYHQKEQEVGSYFSRQETESKEEEDFPSAAQLHKDPTNLFDDERKESDGSKGGVNTSNSQLVPKKTSANVPLASKSSSAISQPISTTDLTIEEVLLLIKRRAFTQLARSDRFTAMIESGNILHGFCEAERTFPPTYKYEVVTSSTALQQGNAESKFTELWELSHRTSAENNDLTTTDEADELEKMLESERRLAEERSSLYQQLRLQSHAREYTTHWSGGEANTLAPFYADRIYFRSGTHPLDRMTCDMYHALPQELPTSTHAPVVARFTFHARLDFEMLQGAQEEHVIKSYEQGGGSKDKGGLRRVPEEESGTNNNKNMAVNPALAPFTSTTAGDTHSSSAPLNEDAETRHLSSPSDGAAVHVEERSQIQRHEGGREQKQRLAEQQPPLASQPTTQNSAPLSSSSVLHNTATESVSSPKAAARPITCSALSSVFQKNHAELQYTNCLIITNLKGELRQRHHVGTASTTTQPAIKFKHRFAREVTQTAARFGAHPDWSQEVYYVHLDSKLELDVVRTDYLYVELSDASLDSSLGQALIPLHLIHQPSSSLPEVHTTQKKKEEQKVEESRNFVVVGGDGCSSSRKGGEIPWPEMSFHHEPIVRNSIRCGHISLTVQAALVSSLSPPKGALE